MIEEPLRLVCFEHRGELSGGTTRPLLMAAMDDAGNERKVVLKVRTPDTRDGHFAGTSLACELISSVLARALGVAVPNYAIVEVPAELPPTVTDGRARALLAANVGENFGSEYHEGYALWNSFDRPTSEGLIEALEDVLSFDAAVVNGDRKALKPNLLWRGDSTLAIDHSLALPVHLWDAAVLAASPLMPDDEVRQHCVYSSILDRRLQYVRVPQMLAEVTPADLQRLRALIPGGWERRPGDIDKIFTFLEARPARSEAIGDALRRIMR